MSETKYKVVAKEFNGIEVSSMIIENEDGKRKKILKQDIIKLARGGKLSNAQSLFDYVNSEYIVAFDDTLLNIETIDRSNGIHLNLSARLIKDDKCIGYKAVDDKGKSYKLSIEKIWELAEKGSVNNIKAKINGKHKVLVSYGDTQLKDLPIIKE